MNGRILIASSLVFWLLGAGLSATAIVAFRTPTRIILAGDSLVRSGAERETVCKVRPAGKWWFNLAGYFGDPDLGLDIPAVIARAIAPTKTLADAKAEIGRIGGPLLGNALDATRRRLPPGFELGFEVGRPVLTVNVAGIGDDKVLSVDRVVFVLATARPVLLTAYVSSCPGLLCPDGRLYQGAGSNGPVLALLTAPLPDWVRTADAAAAVRIITAQIRATPDEVGPPIDVVEITASSAKWVNREKGSACPS